jgi:hypothetical protein
MKEKLQLAAAAPVIQTLGGSPFREADSKQMTELIKI